LFNFLFGLYILLADYTFYRPAVTADETNNA
jgi:hypothetical protein